MKNIFFIGMPGSGKTTLGKRVAEKLHRVHLDTDKEITKREGMTPEKIILMHGEERLRLLEKELLLELIQSENLLVSTGGGFPVYNDNMAIMNERSVTLYLRYPAEILWARLKKDHLRPLSRNFEELSGQLGERSRIYEKAHIIVDGEEDISRNTATAVRALNEYLASDQAELL